MNLKEAFEQNKELSLRKLAGALNISHANLLKKSKEPVAGQVYDPDATNWTAVEAAIKKAKPDLDISTLDFDKIAGIKVFTPERDPGLELNDVFTMSYKPYADRLWKVIYKTPTHYAILPIGGTEPKVMGAATLVACGAKKSEKLAHMAEEPSTENEPVVEQEDEAPAPEGEQPKVESLTTEQPAAPDPATMNKQQRRAFFSGRANS